MASCLETSTPSSTSFGLKPLRSTTWNCSRFTSTSSCGRALKGNKSSASYRAPVMIYDDYKEDATPPCYLEPLSKLLWITHVYALYHMAWPHPKRQRQSKKKKAKNRKVSIN
ncbi:hypothetical protein PF011_g30037 [Phytophthora fragariae]|uniref:Uncharacterized protein n=1 Tax=Phytophthora fragariae TaxID=53985 RepID=A0A6A3GU63_9STRA|nr:hypothetical protein PF011_g30037 [Phytophthora fragariae]